MLNRTFIMICTVFLCVSALHPVAMSQDVESIIAGKQAPNIVAKTLDGKDFDLSKLKGKLVLVDFWATWCPPCRKEIPHLVETYKKFKDKGLVIVSVAVRESEDSVKEFVKEHKMDWIHIIDQSTDQGFKYAGMYDVSAIPTPFLLDKDGKVLLRGSEDFTDTDLHGEQLMRDIEKYIKLLPDSVKEEKV